MNGEQRRAPWMPANASWRYTVQDNHIQHPKMSIRSTNYRVLPRYPNIKAPGQQKPSEKHVILMPRRKRTPPPRIEHDYLYIRPRKLSEEELYQRFHWGNSVSQGNVIQNQGILNYSVDELEARRQRAIAEEAVKKQKKLDEYEKLNEPRYIELGFLLCSLTPDDLDILSEENVAKIDQKMSISGERYVSNLGKFCTELTNFLGDSAKNTIFSDGFSLASSLSQVYRKAFDTIDYRLEKEQFRQEIKVKRDEQREQTKQLQKIQKLDDRYIAIGRALCSLKPEDFFNLSTSSESSSESPEAVPTPKKTKKQKEREIRAEDDPEVVTYRGEELLENAFDFCDYVGCLLEGHARWTIFRSPAEFTHIFCNVAEKSVRDRRRKGKRSSRMARN